MRFFDMLPRQLLTLLGIALVGAIGFIDWKTGDYSILTFYSIPIFVVSWSAGRWSGIVICAFAGCARFVADIPLHDYSLMNYWNSLEDTTLFIIMSVLVSQLRKKLD